MKNQQLKNPKFHSSNTKIYSSVKTILIFNPCLISTFDKFPAVRAVDTEGGRGVLPLPKSNPSGIL